MKMFSNAFTLEFELFFTFFPSTTVRGLCFHVKMHVINVKIPTKPVNEPTAAVL